MMTQDDCYRKSIEILQKIEKYEIGTDALLKLAEVYAILSISVYGPMNKK